MEDAILGLGGLERRERLLVWALRAVALGQEDCPILRRAFEETCGPMGLHVMTGYYVVVKLIAMTGRRRLRVHIPGCGCVSPDEKAIVDIIAAAEASPNGDRTVLNERFAALLGQEASPTLILATQAVGRMLKQQGATSPPLSHPASRRPMNRKSTLH